MLITNTSSPVQHGIEHHAGGEHCETQAPGPHATSIQCHRRRHPRARARQHRCTGAQCARRGAGARSAAQGRSAGVAPHLRARRPPMRAESPSGTSARLRPRPTQPSSSTRRGALRRGAARARARGHHTCGHEHARSPRPQVHTFFPAQHSTAWPAPTLTAPTRDPAVLTQRRRAAKHLPVVHADRFPAPRMGVVVLDAVDASNPHGGHCHAGPHHTRASGAANAQAHATQPSPACAQHAQRTRAARGWNSHAGRGSTHPARPSGSWCARRESSPCASPQHSTTAPA